MTVTQSTVIRSAELHAHVLGDRCPWCDQPIPHEKFEEISGRIATKERERALEAERILKEQVAVEKMQLEAKMKSELEQARKDGEALINKVRQEALAKEAAVREEGRKAAELAMAEKIAQAEQAKQAAELQLKEQRDIMEKARIDAVNAEKAKHFEEKLKLEEKLQQVQRQLQQKTAEELGEGAEVDLFEALKSEFENDQITRVAKGAAGADIVHRIIYNSRVSGCIVYDSKNRNAWRNDYVTKLRQDQLSEKADHAILSTHVFPAGVRQFHVQDGIIIANPARVIAVVQMLRKHVIQTHGLRLSNEARQQKTDRLYEFITSDRCKQLLDQIETLTEDILDIDVKETVAHKTIWKHRGELLRSIQRVHGNFIAEVEGIIGTGVSDPK